MLKAILWDNDGVLVDTEGLYFQASRETLERLGVRLSEARFIELFLKASEGLTKIAAEHGIDEQALEPARIWRNLIRRYMTLLITVSMASPGRCSISAAKASLWDFPQRITWSRPNSGMRPSRLVRKIF